jgi:hypothetical protein
MTRGTGDKRKESLMKKKGDSAFYRSAISLHDYSIPTQPLSEYQNGMNITVTVEVFAVAS